MGAITRRGFLAFAPAVALASCTSFTMKGSTTVVQLSAGSITSAVNGVRESHSKGRLSFDYGLQSAARAHAVMMAERGELSHDFGPGLSLRDRIKRYGQYRTAAENVAYGQNTLEEALQGWLNSSGHRRNLLSDAFTRFGLAAVSIPQDNGRQRVYWAMIFGD